MKAYEIKTTNTAGTEALGAALARALLADGRRRAFIALEGDMGVGKTAFVRGFATALGCRAVHSPTYTVVNEYRGEPLPVFHFDLYRVGDADELYALGFDDYLGRDGFCLCEWSERGGDMLPPDRMTVSLFRTEDGDDERRLVFRDCPPLD